MTKLFDLRQAGATSSDCTAPYDVIFHKQCTVREFVDYVLTSDEWGYIGVYKRGSIFGDPCCEYSYGKLKTNPLPEGVLSKIIVCAEASGGWTRMDYQLHLASEITEATEQEDKISNDFISRKCLLEALDKLPGVAPYGEEIYSKSRIANFIRTAPAADVVPSEDVDPIWQYPRFYPEPPGLT